jgi:hypothetical protein
LFFLVFSRSFSEACLAYAAAFLCRRDRKTQDDTGKRKSIQELRPKCGKTLQNSF